MFSKYPQLCHTVGVKTQRVHVQYHWTTLFSKLAALIWLENDKVYNNFSQMQSF